MHWLFAIFHKYEYFSSSWSGSCQKKFTSPRADDVEDEYQAMQHVEKRNQEDLAMPNQAASELKLSPAAHAKIISAVI